MNSVRPRIVFRGEVFIQYQKWQEGLSNFKGVIHTIIVKFDIWGEPATTLTMHKDLVNAIIQGIGWQGNAIIQGIGWARYRASTLQGIHRR